jgi:RNA polymerase subunit RPABC4/transcription elongation factor Spt4
MQAAEARLHAAGFQLCPYCDAEIERDFLRCPACLRKLKDACQNCARPLDPQWRICPYCEAEVGAPPEEPRRRRRSAQATT